MPPGRPHIPAQAPPPQTWIRPRQATPVTTPGPPAPPPPGYLPPGYLPPGLPPAPQRPNRGRRNSILISVVLVALLAISAGLFAATMFSGGATETMADPAVSMPPSPGPGDSSRVREKWLMAKAQAELDSSAQALIDGDEKGWLAVYDDAAEDEMAQRYDSLSNLGVSFFDYQIKSESPESASGDSFKLQLIANYCLGGDKHGKCEPTSIFFETSWSDSDGEVLIDDVEESEELGPRPWEVEDLRAEVGDRAIVAGPAKYSDELDHALEVADNAAKNADQYAKFGRVDRYVVYLAGDEEFERWYGLDNSMDNVVGFAIPLTRATKNGESKPGGSDVVVHADRVRDDAEFEATMRHELGHVATLHHSKVRTKGDEQWWLSEGLAELIDQDPEQPLDDYVRMSDVKKYLSREDWDGELERADPNDNPLAGSAKYGIAFLATYHLYDEYGKDKFMDFFEKVARNGDDPDEAAQDVYDKSYSDLTEDAADFVKDTAG